MLAKDIKVGGKYRARVSGVITTVRVDSIETGRGLKGNQTYYNVTNLRTGRRTTFRSAAKFRSETTGEGKNDPLTEALERAKAKREEQFNRAAAQTVAHDRKQAQVDPQDDSERAFDTADDTSRAKEGEQCSDPTTARSATETQTNASVPGPSSEKGTATSPVTNGNLQSNYVSPGDDEPDRLHRLMPSKLASRLSAIREGNDDSPHVIVEARAGTGKTTTLIEGLKLLKGMESKLTPSPQQKAVWDAICLSKGKAKTVCFVAFNKSIAEELQKRVPDGCEAMTMHSMGYRVVTKAFGRQEPNKYVVQDLTAGVMGLDVREAKRRKGAVLSAVEELVSLCKMNLVAPGHYDPEDTGGEMHWAVEFDKLINNYNVDTEGVDLSEVYELVPKVLEMCKTPKGKISFDDMIWLPVMLGLPVPKYDLLLVDEAQDLNRCQQELAKRAGHRLILVGDPKQAIYGFAGADSESMSRMYNELKHRNMADVLYPGSDRRGCMILPLTVTRRCGKAIVAEAQRIVPDFEAHEDNPEGTVRTALMATRKRPVIKAEDNYADQIGSGDFALCRINAPLVSECFRFLRQGRKATIQGRDVGQGLIRTVDRLSGKNDGMPVKDLVFKLSDWLSEEIAKEQAKRNPSESRITGLQDRHDCILCFTEGATRAGEVKAKIESVFTDDKNSPGIRLSSIHKAKGLEARRVFILQVEFGMRKDKMRGWELEQEQNLEYVAVTRAIEELVYVS